MDDLGTPALSWRDLQVIVHRAPPGSPIHRSVDPEGARWSSGELVPSLLAHVADLLAGGNWQRAGNKNAARPKPISRPGVKSDAKTLGSDPIPISDFDAWWNAER